MLGGKPRAALEGLGEMVGVRKPDFPPHCGNRIGASPEQGLRPGDPLVRDPIAGRGPEVRPEQTPYRGTAEFGLADKVIKPEGVLQVIFDVKHEPRQSDRQCQHVPGLVLLGLVFVRGPQLVEQQLRQLAAQVRWRLTVCENPHDILQKTLQGGPVRPCQPYETPESEIVGIPAPRALVHLVAGLLRNRISNGDVAVVVRNDVAGSDLKRLAVAAS